MKRRVAWLIALLLLSGCGVFKVVKEPEPAPTGPLKTMKFEGGNEGDQPAGWEVRTYNPEEGPVEGEAPKFEMEYTESEKRSGEMSAVLRPVGKEKLGLDNFTDAHFCGEPPFQGAAVRASAFIKGDPGGIVRFGANLSTDNAGPSGTLQKRGGDWTKFEVVNVYPPPPPTPTATKHRMCVSLGVSGSNRAWIDDVTFTKLDLQSLPPEKVQALPLENLDMERFDRAGSLANWTLVSNARSGELRPGFKLRADRRVKRSGDASLLLTTDEPLEKPPGDSADYCADPAPLLGKTLRVSGWMSADLGEGTFANAVLSAGAFGFTPEEIPTLTPEDVGRGGDSSSAGVHVHKPIDWTQYQVIFSVPNTAKSVCISIRLDQVGSVWADDLSVELIQL